MSDHPLIWLNPVELAYVFGAVPTSSDECYSSGASDRLYSRHFLAATIRGLQNIVKVDMTPSSYIRSDMKRRQDTSALAPARSVH